MGLSIKKRIKTLAPLRALFIIILLLFVFFFVGTPIFNRWIYPLEYEDEIINSAQITGADPFLVMAIIRVESKFNPDGFSRAGAQGLMQLMPETVRLVIKKGKFSSTFKDYVNDPIINIHMGSWYLANLSKEFKDNKVAVIAAYNAGPGNVKKWLRESIWNGTRKSVRQIPFGETRHYVQRVTFFYEKYKQVYKNLVY
jgi:soluble lytic murein transglycosylase